MLSVSVERCLYRSIQHVLPITQSLLFVIICAGCQTSSSDGGISGVGDPRPVCRGTFRESYETALACAEHYVATKPLHAQMYGLTLVRADGREAVVIVPTDATLERVIELLRIGWAHQDWVPSGSLLTLKGKQLAEAAVLLAAPGSVGARERSRDVLEAVSARRELLLAAIYVLSKRRNWSYPKKASDVRLLRKASENDALDRDVRDSAGWAMRHLDPEATQLPPIYGGGD